MSRIVQPAQQILPFTMAFYAFLLPFKGVGNYAFKDIVGVGPDVIVAALAAPFVAALMLHRIRDLIGNPITSVCLAIGSIGALSTFVNAYTFAGVAQIARELYMPLIVCGIWLCSREGRAFVLQATMVGALLGIVIGLIGYVGMIFFGDITYGVNPFLFSTPHPIFSNFYRFTGFYGHAPQHQGEFLVSVIAIGLALYTTDWGRSRRPLLITTIGFSALGLVLTFAYAWVGGFALAYGIIRLTRKLPNFIRMLALPGLLLAVLAATWLINIGMPEKGTASFEQAPCAEQNMKYYVTQLIDKEDYICRQPFIDTPYRARFTLYLDAKIQALNAIKAYPLLGVGAGNYERNLVERLRPVRGEQFSYYVTPHCTFLELPTESGIAGWFLVVFLLVAILGTKPDREEPHYFVWLGVAGMLLIGINIDILPLRHFWVLLGVLALGRQGLPE